MCNWRERLRNLVAANGTDQFPLLVFRLSPSQCNQWHAQLPACQGIRDLYNICDGGPLSLQYTFDPFNELLHTNQQWQETLHDYYGDGQPVLIPDRHTVLGHDSGGAALIWDSKTDAMATFFAKGGDWGALNFTFEEFMQKLFFEPDAVHAGADMWPEALQQLEDA